MIQLSRHALMVCHEDGRMEPIGFADLVSLLPDDSKAAVGALDPGVIQTVFDSVIRHIRDDLNKDRLPLSELVGMISGLLDGYSEEVLHPGEAKPSHLELDLFETARLCGPAYELEFYDCLRRFFSEHARPDGRSVRITGLRRCAKLLAGRRRWSKRSREMRDEIVAFIRGEVVRAGSENLSLTLGN